MKVSIIMVYSDWDFPWNKPTSHWKPPSEWRLGNSSAPPPAHYQPRQKNLKRGLWGRNLIPTTKLHSGSIKRYKLYNYDIIYNIYIYIHWVRPHSCNSQQKYFFIFWANVVLSVFLRAQNRAFWCSPSCQKPCSRSCFLVLSLVHKIVFFGALPRAKNCAFWCSPSCQKPCSRSCFLVLSFVPKIVL